MKSGRAANELEADLLWHKDAKGYALEDHGKYGLWIARRGGELVPFYPLRGGFAFKAFSNVSTPKDLIEFMNCYGFLSSVNGCGPAFFRVETGKLYAIKGAPEPSGEDVREHLESAGFFREILGASPRRALSAGASRRRALSPGAGAWAENLGSDGIGEIQMLFDKHGSLRPVLKPTSLMSGLFWQLISFKQAGAQYRSCQYCGSIFQVGVGSGRRTGAIFCSDEHKIEFHSRKRSVR
jgi:hypothetical protein